MSSLLRHSAAGFSALEAHLADRLAEQMAITAGHRPSPGERRSWERSLPALAADLNDAGLGGVEMLIEYQLPLTSKRADVVLAGTSARTGRAAYLVVELKQWTEAERFEDSEVLVSVPGYGRPVTHPLDQVRGYCEYLQDFAAVLADTPDSVAGVAYLHNATDFNVADLLARPQDSLGRMFTGQRRGEFRDFLRSFFTPESGAYAADLLLGSKIAPSKQLMALAAEEVQRREMFVLLDEQRDAFEYVQHAVASARRQNTKTAVVVSGGPGSGKSVIALSLMGELAREGRTVVHATGSQSFTQTLRKVAAKGSPRVRKAFQYFNSFMASEPNELDVLILDEAHRIRETSVNRFTKASMRTGRPQIDELLAAARTPVFLLDQFQVVRPGELGTVADITAAAAAHGIDVMHVRLDDQFRCGGSLAYVRWVERLLGLAPGGPIPWAGRRRLHRLGDGLPARARGLARGPVGRRLRRPDVGRLLLAVERPAPGRFARAGRRDRRLVPAVEPQGRPVRRRGAAVAAVGDRPGRLRPGRVHLHRAGVRVRLRRRHHRPGPRLARRPLGDGAHGEPRSVAA